MTRKLKKGGYTDSFGNRYSCRGTIELDCRTSS